eukprot:COSAG01_NODE_48_length_31904_cov_21.696997_11_plen_144_part_00
MVAAAEQGVHLYAGRTLSGDDVAAATQAPEEDQLVRKFAQTLRDGDASVGLQAWLAMVSRAFPSGKRSILTEIYLCHACSDHEIEDRNARAGAGGERAGGERAEDCGASGGASSCQAASPKSVCLVHAWLRESCSACSDIRSD